MTILTKLQMREYVPKNKLTSFLESDFVRTIWTDEDKKKIHKSYVVKKFTGEKAQLDYYLNKMDKNGMTYVEYDVPSKNQGRHTMRNCLSSYRRIVRNYLLCDDYYDFDMINSFASIIYMLAKRYNLRDCNIIEDFVNNRTTWIEGLMKEMNKNKDDVKKFIISVAYSNPDDKKKIEWNDMMKFGSKLRKLKTIITTLTSTLMRCNDYHIQANEDNYYGSWISHLVMSIEDDIVVGFMNYMKVNYPLLFRNPYNPNDLIPVGTYEFDGFKLLKKNVDEFGGPDAVIGCIFQWLLENGYNTNENEFIKFSCKSMDDKLTDIPDLYVIAEVDEVAEDNISLISTTSESKSIDELNTDDLKDIIKKKKQKEQEDKKLEKQKEQEDKKLEKQREKEEKERKKQIEKEEKERKKQREVEMKNREKERKRQEKEAEKNHKEQMKLELKEKKALQHAHDIEMKEKNSRFAENDIEAANLIYDDLKDKLKNADGKIYYKNDKNVWITKDIEKSLLYNILHSNIRQITRRDDDTPPIISDYAQNTHSASNIRAALLSIVNNQNDSQWFANSLSSSTGKILFNNGYLDFYNNKFVPSGSDDYDYNVVFFVIIDRDYIAISNDPESEERKNLEKYKNQIFYVPFTKEIGDWYMLQLARGIAGDAMKRMLFGIGNSNTGKSVMGAIMKDCFGDYVGSFNGENLIYHKNKTTDEAANMRWVLLHCNRRIIFSSEIKMGCQIDGNIIKKLSNGGKDVLTGREHCSNEISFKIRFLPIAYLNDIDNITPCDDAVVGRVRAIPYNKVFVDGEPENEYQLKKLDEYNSDSPNCILETHEFINCIIQMIFERYSEYIKNGRQENEPTEIKKANENVIGDTKGNVIDGFLELFEITNNQDDFMPSCYIEEEYLKGLQMSSKKFVNEMNKFLNMKSNEGKYTNVVNGVAKRVAELGGKQVKGWVGIKRR